MSASSFDKLSDTLCDKFWSRPSGLIPKIVYHYTNAAGLFGMLTSKRVWATDCRFLNDETESELGIINARKFVRARAFTEKNNKIRLFYRTLSEYLRIEDPDRNFLFSLSEKRDDLSQWRAYANEGRGFTVGFKTESLLKNGGPSLNTYGFSKVIYNATTQDKQVRDIVRTFEKHVSESGLTGTEFDKLVDEAAMSLDWLISVYSVLYKHSSFVSEKKWRVNTYSSEDDPGATIKVRANGDRLVPYIELKLCGDDENCLPIECIGVGPGFKDGGVKFAVEKLCEQTNFTVNIYNADTPFRRL